MIVTQKTRVHNKLLELVRNGVFYQESFDTETGEMSVCETVKPKSCYTDETASGWSEGTRRRSDTRDRGDWTWDVMVEFVGPVDASAFQAALSDRVPGLGRVLADPDTGQMALTSIRLMLESADYSHPPRVSPTGGTKITYTFSAKETHR